VTVTVDPAALDAAFEGALDSDASTHTAAPPPPRTPWLNEDGSPKYGLKADGSPKKGAGGPGRGHKARPESAPRGSTKAPATAAPAPAAGKVAPAAPGEPKDYTDDISGALFLGWMGLASTPWTKPQAAVVKNCTPQMVPAWNTAAQQNATVRTWVEKLSGEGSWAWLLPVTMTTAPLALGIWESIRDKAARAALTAQTEADWQEFLQATAEAHGLELASAETLAQMDASAAAAATNGSAAPEPGF
jgi:hypothetical protein